jgi:hypothetical protein
MPDAKTIPSERTLTTVAATITLLRNMEENFVRSRIDTGEIELPSGITIGPLTKGQLLTDAFCEDDLRFLRDNLICDISIFTNAGAIADWQKHEIITLVHDGKIAEASMKLSLYVPTDEDMKAFPPDVMSEVLAAAKTSLAEKAYGDVPYPLLAFRLANPDVAAYFDLDADVEQIKTEMRTQLSQGVSFLSDESSDDDFTINGAMSDFQKQEIITLVNDGRISEASSKLWQYVPTDEDLKSFPPNVMSRVLDVTKDLLGVEEIHLDDNKLSVVSRILSAFRLTVPDVASHFGLEAEIEKIKTSVDDIIGKDLIRFLSNYPNIYISNMPNVLCEFMATDKTMERASGGTMVKEHVKVIDQHFDVLLNDAREVLKQLESHGVMAKATDVHAMDHVSDLKDIVKGSAHGHNAGFDAVVSDLSAWVKTELESGDVNRINKCIRELQQFEATSWKNGYADATGGPLNVRDTMRDLEHMGTRAGSKESIYAHRFRAGQNTPSVFLNDLKNFETAQVNAMKSHKLTHSFIHPAQDQTVVAANAVLADVGKFAAQLHDLDGAAYTSGYAKGYALIADMVATKVRAGERADAILKAVLTFDARKYYQDETAGMKKSAPTVKVTAFSPAKEASKLAQQSKPSAAGLQASIEEANKHLLALNTNFGVDISDTSTNPQVVKIRGLIDTFQNGIDNPKKASLTALQVAHEELNLMWFNSMETGAAGAPHNLNLTTLAERNAVRDQINQVTNELKANVPLSLLHAQELDNKLLAMYVNTWGATIGLSATDIVNAQNVLAKDYKISNLVTPNITEKDLLAEHLNVFGGAEEEKRFAKMREALTAAAGSIPAGVPAAPSSSVLGS